MRKFFQGVIWVAGVYFYFLIFAQFTFLEVLEKQDLAGNTLKLIMVAMAIGGLTGSALVIPMLRKWGWKWHRLMRVAALLSACLAVLSFIGMSWLGLVAYVVLSFGIGFGLGILTIVLAAHLAVLTQPVYLAAALGTGLAYMLSNVPPIFTASLQVRCFATAAGMLLLALIPLKLGKNTEYKDDSDLRKTHPRARGNGLALFPIGLIWFTMLVWLDSAAFYIIQHNQTLKQATWGEPYLWRNALVHLLVALLAGWLLARKKWLPVLFSAFGLLSVSGLMASIDSLSGVAGLLYPAGVSLYSVGLILYPAVYLSHTGALIRTVALLAVAGWIGSTLGIGMAQDLHHVPPAFVMIAAVVMVGSLTWKLWWARKTETLYASGLAVIILAVTSFTTSEKPTTQELLSLGRKVYISEGCIHCHSRYVRPTSKDVELWGPVAEVKALSSQQPVMIGNRRQGPDLLHVGLRRSKPWLKQHFIDPQSLVPKSTMPSYRHLFDDTRGNALVEYLAHYQAEDMVKRQAFIQQWKPTVRAFETSVKNGKLAFNQHCAACHGVSGKGDGKLAKHWLRPPANLVDGPFLFSSKNVNETTHAEGDSTLNRVIKFGIPGTDMPGHEYLTDSELHDLVQYVRTLRNQQNNEKNKH